MAQRVRLPASLGRNGTRIAETCAPVAARALPVTVRVLDGRDLASLGSMVTTDGWILTIASTLPANGICELADGRRLPITERRIVEEHDLALVKVDGQGLPVLDWTGSSELPLEVGRWAISAQPGRLPVIGVIGVGPRRVRPQPAFLGVVLEDTDSGPVIARVVPDTAAARAGLMAQDRVNTAAGETVRNKSELMRTIRRQRPGSLVEFGIARGEQEIAVNVVLGQPSGEDEEFENAGPVSIRRSGFPAVFQHDGPLAPEQCGGPVLSVDGEWLGINIARVNRTASFAIPASVVREVLREHLVSPTQNP